MGERALAGKRVLVTRARDQASVAAEKLSAKGAEPVLFATIEIASLAGDGAKTLDEAVTRIGTTYDVVLFTSANAVRETWRALERCAIDPRGWTNLTIAAVGPATARALETHGARATIVAKDFRGEGLANEVIAAMESRATKPRVLLPRARIGRDALPDALRAAGIEVDVVVAYDTIAPSSEDAEAIAKALEAKTIDAVTFTSSSSVDHFCDLFGTRAPALLASTIVASIGPLTTQTADVRGVRVDVTAAVSTLDGLIDALEAHFSA